ncbi:unnamed protein product [Phytophthora lilii]|uniref:Unnamed protein product n=1 Tax=Phytophthora lilii TaxID=2077276 RepID=A0A9W6YFF4_9STRA|nr:unnamed protein product [Phytophthora lilii]
MAHEELRQLTVKNEEARSMNFSICLKATGYESTILVNQDDSKLTKKHDATLASLETQIKDAEKKIKSLERAISARNKKIAAVSKKVAQKTKELAEWKTKIDVKQTDIANSAATQQLIDGEVQRAQELLDKEQSRFESFQQRRTAQEMETEELRSSCATLETETHQLRKSVATMKDNAAAAQTAVKNRVDEIREKFLSSFVVNDVDILIDLLNKEVRAGKGSRQSHANICPFRSRVGL